MIKNAIEKIIRVFSYLFMKTSISLAYTYCFISLILNNFLQKNRNNKKYEIVIFLHSPVNSDGHFRRFKVFYPLLKKDNISFREFAYADEKKVHHIYDSPMQQQYLFFQTIAWKRAFQIPKGLNSKVVVIQRNLFPVYPDYKVPIFEKMLHLFHRNIVLDIWDPVHIWNPKLTYESFKYVNKITVNTLRLKEEYKKYFNEEKIFVWPIAIDFDKYQTKSNRESNIIKLFYTGSENNTKQYLNPIIPILEKISEKVEMELSVMGKYAPESEKLKINHYKWDDSLLIKIISDATIGLYPNFNEHRNKDFTVAGKVLDYMASQLPIIGADQGLPEGVVPEDIMMIANKIDTWEDAVLEAINNYKEMQLKAEKGFYFVYQNLNHEKIYKELLMIIN